MPDNAPPGFSHAPQEEALYIKYKRWVARPHAFPTEPRFEGMAGMKALFEDALWAAYREGYQTCLADAQAALQALPPPRDMGKASSEAV